MNRLLIIIISSLFFYKILLFFKKDRLKNQHFDELFDLKTENVDLNKKKTENLYRK